MTTNFDLPEVRPYEVTLFKHKGVKLHCEHFATEPEGWKLVDSLPATQDFVFRNLATHEVLAGRPQAEPR